MASVSTQKKIYRQVKLARKVVIFISICVLFTILLLFPLSDIDRQQFPIFLYVVKHLKVTYDMESIYYLYINFM